MKKPVRLFVQLHHEILDTPAWRSMPPAARCLYAVLRRRYNQTRNNNGGIFISQRDAAEELGLARPTVAAAFQALVHFGFIVMTQPATLGPDGKGSATHWRLTELETADAPPTMDFKNWNGTRFRRPRKRSRPRTLKTFSTIREHASCAGAKR
jgi:hypothetical protein